MVHVGDKLFLAGTRVTNLRDLDADARGFLNNIESSYKYKMAHQHIIKHPIIKHLIGYSLGAALADTLTSNIDTIKSARLYNSPSITRKNSHKKSVFFNLYDPVQGLFKNEKGEASYHQGSRYGHFLSGHRLIYS